MHPSADGPDQDPAQDRTRMAGGQVMSGADLKIGDIIGESYQVLRWIGAGGMGNVYCVRHTIMEREYALKTLSADKISEVAWRRFQNEAQAIGRMSHPNVVAIYNLGVHGGYLPYYVMDLLHGKSLQDVISLRGALPVNEVVSLCLEVSAGLGYAHRKGIVHRDVKPGNIIILDKPEPNCRLKIVDFGLAKLSGLKDPKNQFLTNTGDIFGSPYYMSPEQSMGERIDARSDIYSLGCTMFELLTGAPPLRGATAMATMLMQQTTAPPTLKAAAGKEFPEMLEQVVATLLAKAPMDRYQTLELLAQDLQAIQKGNQLAINPYSDGAARAARQIEGGADRQADGKPGRRQYENEEAVEEAEKERSSTARAAVVAGICIVGLIAGLVAGADYIWKIKTRPKPQNHSYPSLSEADGMADAFIDGTSKFSTADRLLNRAERNKQPPTTSLTQTTPFRHDEKIQGRMMQVFDFPTDITIGDVRTARRKDVPAVGRLTFEKGEQIEFAPDVVLLKYPQYLKRFREGDIFGLKIISPEANDALFALTYNLPGVRKIHMEKCPNMTQKSMHFVDEMKSLTYLQVEHVTQPAEYFENLKCLDRIPDVSINTKDDPSGYVKLVAGRPNIRYLGVECSSLQPADFKNIATIPNLQSMSLNQSHFAPADLQQLINMPNLKIISMTECPINFNIISNLRRIKSLERVDLTEPDDIALKSQIVGQLAPKRVVFHSNPREVPITSKYNE